MEENASKLPDHVQTVSDGLLNFDNFLGLEAMTTKLGLQPTDENDDQLYNIPISAYRVQSKVSWRAQELHWMMEKEFINDAKVLYGETQKLKNKGGASTKCDKIFLKVIRNRIEIANIDSSLGPIAFAQGTSWNTCLDPYKPLDRSPSPDLYFGFPVQEIRKGSSKGFENNEFFKDFGIDTLSELGKHGLQYSPLCDETSDHTAIFNKDIEQLCFPWCVMQLGHSKDNAFQNRGSEVGVEESWATAMAASGSLSILEKLARFAEVKESGQHIPPVIVFTYKGPEVKVSLAFTEIVDDQNRDHNLVHIWHGNVNQFWDAIQYCRILDNMFFWSQHILRPRISFYINQWRSRYCSKPDSLQILLEEDIQIADIVRRTQDRLSSMNLTLPAGLHQLVQQAIIFQEATRSPKITSKETSKTARPSLNPMLEEKISSASKADGASRDTSFIPTHLSPLRTNFDKISLLNMTPASKEYMKSPATLASETIDVAKDKSHQLVPYSKFTRTTCSGENAPIVELKADGEAKRNASEEDIKNFFAHLVANKAKKSTVSTSLKARPILTPLSRLPPKVSNQQREIFLWAGNKHNQEKQIIRRGYSGTLPNESFSTVGIYPRKEVSQDRSPFMVGEHRRSRIEIPSQNPKIEVAIPSEQTNPFTLENFNFRCDFKRADPITREVLESPLDIKVKARLRGYGGQSKTIVVKLPPVIRTRPWNF